MPHLTLTLTNGAPLIDVVIGVSQPRAAVLQSSGQPVPPPVVARLLVDTGASHTCLDHSVITQLGLTPTGTVPMHTPSTGAIPENFSQYDVSIILVHNVTNRMFAAVPVMGSNFAPQGFQGLLGRDILKDCLLIYTGPDNAFMLSM